MTMTKPASLPSSLLDDAHDTRLTVNLGALMSNIARYRALAHGADVAGVAKGNAYGLGLTPVAFAMASAGVTRFFVTDVFEGAALRALLPNVTIHLTNGLPHGAAPAARAAGLSPCIGSLAELEAWTVEAEAAGRPLPAALHFDTGINRLGFDGDETPYVLANANALKMIDISLVMSHLACADEPDHPLNRHQLDRFRTIAAAFPGIPKSLANSAGVLLGPDYCFDLVRPGYAVYGGNPVTRRPSPVAPVITAEAQVLQIREVAPDEISGYGATWVSPGHHRLATLSVGYADGYFRSLGSASGAARVFIGGRYAPVAGRVSMDLLTIDITEFPPGAVKRGDFAELIGPHVPLEEVAARADTIGYEVLTSLGDRYARHYTGGTTSTES
jgi:alanine racemase